MFAVGGANIELCRAQSCYEDGGSQVHTGAYRLIWTCVFFCICLAVADGWFNVFAKIDGSDVYTHARTRTYGDQRTDACGDGETLSNQRTKTRAQGVFMTSVQLLFAWWHD